MESTGEYQNAVLDDKELQKKFKKYQSQVWSLPLIDQKTKALITIAVDVVNQDQTGSRSPFATHVHMALKQGATQEQIEKLLFLMCVYGGFNKAVGCFGTLNERWR